MQQTLIVVRPQELRRGNRIVLKEAEADSPDGRNCYEYADKQQGRRNELPSGRSSFFQFKASLSFDRLISALASSAAWRSAFSGSSFWIRTLSTASL